MRRRPAWQVRVNGEVVQPLKAADAFMLIPLQENAEENIIVMDYKVKGRTVGFCITGVSLLVLVGWGLYTQEKKKRRKAMDSTSGISAKPVS